MDAVQKYRYKRIRRLEERLGTYHGAVRFDDDNDETNNNGNNRGNNGFHGNTRIPFGLCQREGIQIGKDWTPKDAWDALAGKGYSAGDVYTELKKTGKVAPRAPKEPEISPKELKKLTKNVTDLKKELKKRDKLEKKRKELESRQAVCASRVAYWNRKLESEENIVKEFLDKYGSEDNIPTKVDPEKGIQIGDTWARYEIAKNDIKYTKKDAENAEAEKKKVEEELEETKTQLGGLRNKKEYDEAVDDLLKHSPYTAKVRECRKIDDESEETREHFDLVKQNVSVKEGRLRFERRLLDSCMRTGDMPDAVASHQQRIEKLEQELSEARGMVEKVEKKLEAIESKKAEIKGEADDKEWKLLYDLTVEKDTVTNEGFETPALAGLAEELENGKVKYQGPVKLAATLSEKRIIDRLSGGDRTGGACASLAWAYLANKSGYNVLDFRGGKSTHVFAASSRKGLVVAAGGKIYEDLDGFASAEKALADVEEGKEYFFGTARHATVIKKENGKFMYLELQSSSHEENTWHELNRDALKTRFSSKSSLTYGGTMHPVKTYMVERETAFSNKEVISLLGYINTEKDKQKKGIDGGIK